MSDAAATVRGMDAVRAPWSSASFLVYLGGITILAAVLSLFAIQAGEYGGAGFVAFSALVFAAVAVSAFVLRQSGRLVTAGLLAVSAVAAFAFLVGALLDWFGWLPDVRGGPGFRDFSFSLAVLQLATAAAAAVALFVFRFPLLVFVVAAAGWFFLTDLVSSGGDWSAVVTIAVGVALLLVAIGVDAADARVHGFWLHVVSGLTIGGGLLWFFHDSDLDWALIGIAALAYIALGDRLSRSSWVVLAGWGILQTASHYASKWSDVTDFLGFFYLFPFDAGFDDDFGEKQHQWAGPVTFIVAGLALTAIALLLARRRHDVTPAADVL